MGCCGHASLILQVRFPPPPLFVSVPILQVHWGRCVVLCSGLACIIAIVALLLALIIQPKSTMGFGSLEAISLSTVAILAQGTNWAVADTQVLFFRFESHRLPLLVSFPILQVHWGRCVVLCFWVSCRASFFHLAPVALYPGHTSGQNNQSHWQPAAQL